MSKYVAMIDLETTGTTAKTGILSIGACVFDDELNTFSVQYRFYTTILLDGQVGREITHDTLWWWMQQSEEARSVFNPYGGLHLKEALLRLSDVFHPKYCIREVWSNGADFDVAILQHAYGEANIPVPWSYKMTRCFRTVKELFPNVAKPEFKGVQHNALSDAIHQAEWLHKIHL